MQRATGGRKLVRNRVLRPSMTYQILHDPFWVWCEYHAPRSEAVDETTRYQRMLMQQGIEFERAWTREHYPDAVTIEPAFGIEALKNTLEAMLAGTRAIAQPQLWDLGDESYGKADLLVRDESRGSDLGPFHYRLVEIKRSKSLRDYHVMQAALYNKMVGRIQGETPGDLTVALKTGLERVAFTEVEKQLNETLERWKTLRGDPRAPEPKRPPGVTSSPWRVYGNKWVESRKDLVLLAGVGTRERVLLRQAGIQRVDDLWNLSREAVVEILGEAHGSDAYHVAQAYKTGSPIAKPGTNLAIPRAKRSLYFDFETSDDVHPTEPPHVYLIGCWDCASDQYVKFLARGAEDEARIFTEFFDYVGDMADSRLYHWSDFEVRQMERAILRWPRLESLVGPLISRCVDLKNAVQEAVYLPVPSFSIKCVAPALGFHWRQKNFGAFESMVAYWDFLAGRGESGVNKAILYNEDDCIAMWHVDREITKRIA